MKNFLLLSFVFLGYFSFAQPNSREQFPLFPECDASMANQQEACFYNTLQNYIFNNYKVADEVKSANFKGTVIALFEVDTTGTFKVLYIDAPYESLKSETKRVFASLPKIKPATYSGRATYSKFTLKIAIPLEEPTAFGTEKELFVQDKTNSKLSIIRKNLRNMMLLYTSLSKIHNLKAKEILCFRTRIMVFLMRC